MQDGVNPTVATIQLFAKVQKIVRNWHIFPKKVGS